MAFEKKALKELVARISAQDAHRILGQMIDSLPDELDYADTSSKEVADGILSLIEALPKPGMAITLNTATRGARIDTDR